MDQREGIGVPQAAAAIGVGQSTIRRWVDNAIAAEAGAPLPHPGQRQLRGWRSAVGSGPGRVRRVDRAAVDAVVREQRGEPPGDDHTA
jgi:transposase-like protein